MTDKLTENLKPNQMTLQKQKTVFINDLCVAQYICHNIKHMKVIAIDMEGKHFGNHGIISLIQIATSVHEVYVFDVLQIGSLLFTNTCLLSILTDPEIIKLCYDCRCDTEALYTSFGIKVFGFYDLQIVYTLLFQKQDDPYLKGLHKALTVAGIMSLENDMECINQLNIKRNMKQKFEKEDYIEKLFQRPINIQLLEYCCIDVVHLFAMFVQWHVSLKYILLLTHRRITRFLMRTPYQIQNAIMSKIDFSFKSTLPLRKRNIKNGYHISNKVENAIRVP
jgi:hypothetical protein